MSSTPDLPMLTIHSSDEASTNPRGIPKAPFVRYRNLNMHAKHILTWFLHIRWIE
jgi:hypothetical protein